MKIYNNQKGVSLYLAIVVMTALLSIVLGISVILTRQFKMIKGMENSVVALYAADAGIETALSVAFNDITNVANNYSSDLDNDASYDVDVYCCEEGVGDCVWSAGGEIDCPAGVPSDDSCNGNYYCFKSRGHYKGTQRAIQADL